MEKKKILRIVIIVVVSSAILVPMSISKFKSQEELKGKMDIAEPIFIVEGNEKANISAINNIGYYEFSVKNFKDNKISETGFKYVIEVVSKTDDAIKFELYKEDEPLKLDGQKTEEIMIAGNEKIEKVKTEKQRLAEERENQLVELVGEMAERILAENKEYVGEEVAEEAIEEIKKERKGGKKDEQEKKATRGRRKKTTTE